MSWKCQYCGGSKAIVDCSGSEPAASCVECDWEAVIGDDRRRCIAACAGWGGYYGAGKRCSKPVVEATWWISPYCQYHIKKCFISPDDRHEMFKIALRGFFHDEGKQGIPAAYKTAFELALSDAEIIIRDEQHAEELAARVRRVRANPQTGSSLVYFIEREGLIKIGFTTNLNKRLNAIGKGSSMPDGMTIGPVELLATEPGDRTLEQRLHRRFRSTRVGNSEWFRPSKALRRYIEDRARFQQRANAA